MYSTETYIMITITLYECDLCYLVQDFYSLSKLLGGSGPPSVRHWSDSVMCANRPSTYCV
jgi:hypothetical protein